MRNKSWQFKLGIILIIVSIPLFLMLPVIPFLNLKNKALYTTIIFISAEVIFYSGGFLVGKELFSKYKSYLNPKNWFKKKENKSEAE